jgi:hypothetical protein
MELKNSPAEPKIGSRPHLVYSFDIYQGWYYTLVAVFASVAWYAEQRFVV